MNEAKHIAIIMDGNGRWAEKQGKKRFVGHETGAETIRDITRYCTKNTEIERVSLYAFSTENWKRPKLEVEFLMKLLSRYLEKELPTYIELGVKFEMIGDVTRFSPALQKQIKQLEEETKHGSNLIQHLALNYGSRNEILRAVNSLKNAEMITEESLNNALDCKHDVDLLIRTGGDHRLSNYLLWQAAYAELFFTDTLWPDFTSAELESIIASYKNIDRRFGGVK
jgi:undecaprenyl diphosphate synthase